MYKASATGLHFWLLFRLHPGRGLMERFAAVYGAEVH